MLTSDYRFTRRRVHPLARRVSGTPTVQKLTRRTPPLYLHIAATTQEILQKAIDKVNDLLNIDMGSLVEDKKDVRRERVRVLLMFCCGLSSVSHISLVRHFFQRKWPEEKIPVGLESIRNFNVRAKVVGPTVRVFLAPYTFHTFTKYGTFALIGYVCEIHPAGNGNACPNQRYRLWLRRSGDRS